MSRIRPRFILVTLPALLAALTSAGLAQADTVFSEDFSTAVGVASGYPYVTGADITGTQFMVTAGNIDVVGLPSGAPWACGWSAAGNCLDLVGAGQNGSIASIPSFTLLAGTTYSIRFGASSGPSDSGFLVTLGGFSSTQVATGTHAVTTLQYTPLADETGVRLGFATTFGATAYNGAIIDNVLVTTAPVPEPGTWALMLGGLLALGSVARRQQG